MLVTPQWLNDNLKDPDLVVLYTGFVIKSDFDREHIEGSRFLWADWLAFNTPEGNMFAPDVRTATKILQELGINNNSKVVICHRGGDVTIAARMFMSMEYFGLRNRTYFLNGGIEAWKRAGFPVTDKPTQHKKGNYVAKIDPVLVDKDYVIAGLANKSAEIIDARAKRWYDGDLTGNPRDGHIKGALNIPYPDMLDSTNSLKPLIELEKKFAAVVPNKGKELVTYCFIGQTACVNYLAGRLLGYNIKVYDGSMQEWSRIPSLPVEKKN